MRDLRTLYDKLFFSEKKRKLNPSVTVLSENKQP